MSKEISVKNLSVSYYANEVLKNVSFEFAVGHLIGIIGPNGAGKSTLVKAMIGLISSDTGQVTFKEQPLSQIKKNIAYVPQRSDIDWDFPITVKDTVLLGTYPKLGLFHRPNKLDKTWAMDCLKHVGMETFADRQIGEMSGGQQQRVFLARALAQKADIFFLDEPFVGIDMSSEKVIINTLKELRDSGKTIFVVHHDLNKVEDYFDQLIVLNKALIKAGSVQETFTPEVMKLAYQTPEFIFKELREGE